MSERSISEHSWNATKRLVYNRAQGCCEYCQTCEANIGQAMHVEHIDPEGGDSLDNLGLSCSNCNLSKAKATTAIDPESGERASLFNPRIQVWSEHFAWIDNGLRIRGLTPVGRATRYTFEDEPGACSRCPATMDCWWLSSSQVAAQMPADGYECAFLNPLRRSFCASMMF